MNILKIFVWFFLVISNYLFAQSIQLRKITKLPSQVSETSGIAIFSPSFIWTHNDSGNEPSIYKIDTLGNVLQKIFIKNAKNIDWEDITRDDNYNLFIGDFGNNENNRKDLKIYKISNPQYLSGDSTNAEIIEFYYSNQTLFPPPDMQKIFDAESFIFFSNNLYIFTKNATKPFSGFTYMYKMPAVAGSYKAELIDSFKTGEGLKELWWVTSASISQDKKKLVLLSSDKLFVFYDFEKDNFFKGKSMTFDLGFISQKEAVSFINNIDFFITDEYNQIFEGMNLYKGSLMEFFNSTQVGQLKNLKTYINIGDNDTGITVWLIDQTQNIEITITDLCGRILDKTKLNNNLQAKNFEIPKGIYCIILSDKSGYQHLKFVKY